MRIARTLSGYLIRETVAYCALAFAVLMGLLLVQNLLRRLDELFLVGLTGADLRVVLACIAPMVASYALPLAFLIGLVLALRRLGGDGEIEGMRAAGLSTGTILLPALGLGLAASLTLFWLLGDVEHVSRRKMVQLFKTVAARGAILEPGKFREVGQRLVFVEERDRSGELRGVMIYDHSQPAHPYRIFARRGRFEFEPERAQIRLELFDGDVHLEPRPEHPERYERIVFEAFSYRVDVGPILGADFGPVRPKQMSLAELKTVLARAAAGDPLRELDQKNPVEYAIEIERRRTQPLAPLLFAGCGVPIVLATERRGRNVGLLLALLTALLYYALSAGSEIAVREAWVSPRIGGWTPNFVFAAAAAAFYFAQRDRIFE